MKTATITFHAAHNYGSMLQAYALQQIINLAGHDNEIINLRTPRQRNIYPLPHARTKPFLKQLAYDILCAPYKKDMEAKYRMFESFLEHHLRTTEEYASLDELENARLDYDCFIAGGDQIWNTAPLDFDWSYYLPFTDRKKISYAVSMGPKAESQVTDRDKIKGLLTSYSHIAVRENGTKKIVDSLALHEATITLDPALLLSAEEWKKRIDNNPIIEGDYILVYSPRGSYEKDAFSIAGKIRRKTGLELYTTIYSPQMHLFPKLKKHLATEIWEFLNLLANAKLVVCGSFHAVVFSALFEKPFFAVNGDKDNRMRTFLENTRLSHRSISQKDWKDKITNLYDCDFSHSSAYLDEERRRSINYLKKAIES